jgi:hypothetical protein
MANELLEEEKKTFKEVKNTKRPKVKRTNIFKSKKKVGNEDDDEEEDTIGKIVRPDEVILQEYSDSEDKEEVQER